MQTMTPLLKSVTHPNFERPEPADCVRGCGNKVEPSFDKTLGWFSIPVCDDCSERADQADQIEAEQRRQLDAEVALQKQRAERAQKLKDCGITGRLRLMTFQSFKSGPSGAALSNVERFAKSFPNGSGEGLYLYGPVGCGKTHLACAVANYSFDNLGIEPLVTTTTDLLLKIRAGFTSTTSEMDSLNIYRQSALLVLDDLGVEKETEWSTQALLSIIDYRWVNMKATVITSNYSPDQLEKTLDQRIVSRICGMCAPIQLTGRDYRL